MPGADGGEQLRGLLVATELLGCADRQEPRELRRGCRIHGACSLKSDLRRVPCGFDARNARAVVSADHKFVRFLSGIGGSNVMNLTSAWSIPCVCSSSKTSLSWPISS